MLRKNNCLKYIIVNKVTKNYYQQMDKLIALEIPVNLFIFLEKSVNCNCQIMIILHVKLSLKKYFNEKN